MRTIPTPARNRHDTGTAQTRAQLAQLAIDLDHARVVRDVALHTWTLHQSNCSHCRTQDWTGITSPGCPTGDRMVYRLNDRQNRVEQLLGQQLILTPPPPVVRLPGELTLF